MGIITKPRRSKRVGSKALMGSKVICGGPTLCVIVVSGSVGAVDTPMDRKQMPERQIERTNPSAIREFILRDFQTRKRWARAGLEEGLINWFPQLERSCLNCSA